MKFLSSLFLTVFASSAFASTDIKLLEGDSFRIDSHHVACIFDGSSDENPTLTLQFEEATTIEDFNISCVDELFEIPLVEGDAFFDGKNIVACQFNGTGEEKPTNIINLGDRERIDIYMLTCSER